MEALIGNPQTFVSELIWTVINFFLLYFLLKRFLYTPVIRFMEQRQARVDEKLRKEKDAKTQLQENEARLLARKEEARAKAKRIFDESGEELDRHHNEAMLKAKADAAQTLKDGEAELEERKEKTAGKLKEASPELSDLLAKRLLKEE